jgi:DNA-binding transcriptional ArsR family regulator
MAQNNKNKKGKGTDWKKEILKFLNDNPSGYTITNIAERIGTTRITVSKYLALLEQENKVLSKEIGVYKLYFSKVRKYLELDLIRSFYSAFLSGVKAKFGSDNEKFKKVGYFISDSFFKYLLEQYPESLTVQITSFKDFLQVFGTLYPYHEFMYSKNMIMEEDIDDSYERGLFTLKNTEILKKSEDLQYHFYIFAGVIERTLSRVFKNTPIVCNIESINTKDNEVVFSLGKA